MFEVYEFVIFHIWEFFSPETLLWLKVIRVTWSILTRKEANRKNLEISMEISKILYTDGRQCQNINFYSIFGKNDTLSDYSHMFGNSSIVWMFLSTKSNSRISLSRASSRYFLTFDIFLPATGKHWTWLMIREFFFYAPTWMSKFLWNISLVRV